MSAVCPRCAVAVVPGYVKCPKCHAALPLGGTRRNRGTIDPGGTTVKQEGFPIAAIVIAIVVAGGIVALFGLRTGKPTVTASPELSAVQPAQPVPIVTRSTGPTAETPTTPSGPSPNAVASELDRALKKQRLWGTVEVIGLRVDVRSSGCSDPGMAPLLDSAREPLRRAGLSKLRCLEQSGAVVFERDLQ